MLATQRLRLRVILILLVAFLSWQGWSIFGAIGPRETPAAAGESKRTQGLAAWNQIYSVLTSPRCINCHTATEYPQQGDDRHRHFANVVRGLAGTGVPALACMVIWNECRQYRYRAPTGIWRRRQCAGRTRTTGRCAAVAARKLIGPRTYD